MLINVLRDEDPTHVAVAFDVSRKTFRAEEYTDYKAGRASTPSEFAGQLPLLREVLDALNIVHVGVEGYEADDIIATLTAQAVADGFEVIICTGDRDAFQLVSDQVTMLYPVRGVSEVWRMDPAAVEEKYLVPPNRYSDLAALVGETSDNLPGVPGVGPKTAAKWINQYGDLTGIVAHVDEIKGKVGDNLRAHLDQVLRNRRLNLLVADVPLDVGLADLERRSWQREEVHRVFDSLEFRVLRDRLFATFDSAVDEIEGGFELDASVLLPEDVAGWVEHHCGSERVGVHVIGHWARGEGDAQAMAIATRDSRAAYIDLVTLDETGERVLGAWIEDPARPKAMHDAKVALHALSARGWRLRGLASDTALVAYIVRPDQRSYDLGDLSVRHLGRELASEPTESGGQGVLTFDSDEEPAADAAAEDAMVRASAVLELSHALEDKLEEIGATALLHDIELPLVDVLVEMEDTGIAVDRSGLESLEADFDAKMRAAQEDAYAAIGGEQINLGSPKQLQVVLFEKLGMPKTKRTKTGYTTDAEALADLYAKTEHPFLEAVLRHRDTSRLRVTVEGLLKSVAADGRIHTTYLQTIAATGRLSSTDPNLQNVPIRTEEGRRIREAFVVGEGFEWLMSADYSQIEMRIMAHLSGDEGLIAAFTSGEDLHRFVGSRVFSVEPSEVTSEMRAKIKAMSYGLAYGLSAFGLSRQLTISTEEARGLMDEYFERFGGVRDYLRDVVAQARQSGYTETMLGRRRYLPDLTSDSRQRREMAERMALNAPIQGSAADIIKVAMLRVRRALEESGARSRMLLQVHDELVLEVAPGEREDVEALVRREMGSAVEMTVPLDVNVGLGKTWHAAAH